MHKSALATIALVTGLGAAPLQADELQMVEPPAAQARPMTPSRGQSMAQVERRFGEPSQRYGAVGDPPISRWVYPEFVVYFEYSHVIHAVTTSAQPAG